MEEALNRVFQYIQSLRGDNDGCLRLSELGNIVQRPPQAPPWSVMLREDPHRRFLLLGQGKEIFVRLSGNPLPAASGSSRAEAHSAATSRAEPSQQAEARFSASAAYLECPITGDRMVDPVMAADGFTYERKAIEQWFSQSWRSPQTNTELRHRDLVPNRLVKQIIENSREVSESLAPHKNARLSHEIVAEVPVAATLPSTGENGLRVYEVVYSTLMPLDSPDHPHFVRHNLELPLLDEPCAKILLIRGQLISSNLRKSNLANVDVVSVDGGLGWVPFRALKEMECTRGPLRIFKTLRSIGIRYLPCNKDIFQKGLSMGQISQGENRTTIESGGLFSSDLSVAAADCVYWYTKYGWVPTTRPDGSLILSEQKPHVHDIPIVCQVKNPGTPGLALREWPCHRSEQLSPQVVVPDTKLVGSRLSVVGQDSDTYILVSVEGRKGWLFLTRDYVTTMKQLSERPKQLVVTAGACIQVQLGPQEGGWVLLLNTVTADGKVENQEHSWYSLHCGIGKQFNNCTEKGRYVKSFAMQPNGTSWVCNGVKYDGSGSHTWWNPASELGRIQWAEYDFFALGNDDCEDTAAIAYGSKGYSSFGLQGFPGLLDLLQKKVKKNGIEKVCLFHECQWWVRHGQGTQWNVENKHLGKELRSNSANGQVLCVTICRESGAWLVIRETGFVSSVGVPKALEQQLNAFYSEHKKRQTAAKNLAGAWDAARAAA